MIKEKVKIEPKRVNSEQNKGNAITISNHTVKFVMSWDKPEREGVVSVWHIPLDAEVQSEGWVYGGSTELTSNFLKYGYFVFQISVNLGSYEETEVNYEIYLDGELVRSGSKTFITNYSPTSPPYENIPYGNLPFYTGTYYNINFPMGCSTYAGIGIYPQQMDDELIIGSLSEFQYPVLTITKGVEYLSFYDRDADEKFDSFNSADYRNSNLPELMYDNPSFEEDNVLGIIKAQLQSEDVCDSVLIHPYTNFEIDVQVIPDSISEGEEADIFLQQVDYWGTMTEFPPDQLFDVEIIEGEEYGTLVSTTDSGKSLTQIEQGFKFRANEDIDLDSVDIKLRVSAEIENIILSSANPRNKKRDTKKGKNITNSNTQNPSKLNEITSNDNNFCYEPDFDAFIRKIYGVANVEIGEGLVLEILEPTGSELINDSISATPEMPNIVIKARLKNYNVGIVSFNFNFTLEYTEEREDPDRIISDTFEGTVEVQNSEIAEWTIPWGGKFRGGDVTNLIVTAATNENTYTKEILNPYKIIGENPTKQEVKNGLTIQEQVVAYKENKWCHFSSNGLPSWGVPSGYGLMQLDPPDNNQQIWNWRENREAGVNLLAYKHTRALGYPSRERNKAGSSRALCFRNVTDFTTEEQIWKETFQRYNGGENWRWVPGGRQDDPNTSGNWEQIITNSKGEPVDYGREAWQIYQNVLNGNPPVGW